MIAALLAGLPGAPTSRPLSIVKPSARQFEGGPPLDPGFRFLTGDTIFFSFQILGYQVSPESTIDLLARIEAVDPEGTLLMKPVERPIATQISAEDKEWMPVVRQDIQIPPLALPGTYHIRATVEDHLSKQTVRSEIAFQVRGVEIQPSDTLVARNFRFLRAEEDRDPMTDPVFHPGQSVWARFEITGFRYGDRNRAEVSYGIAILGPAGNQVFGQPQAALEEGESFYPKRYLPGVLSVSLNDKVRPGTYTLVLTLRDLAGNQTQESRHVFRVE